MKFEHLFPDSLPSEVFALFTDEDFLRQFSAEIPVSRHEADINRSGRATSVLLTWAFPTAGAPAAVRGLLPPEVEMIWRTDWSHQEVGASGAFTVHSENPRLVFEGTASVSKAATQGSLWNVSGPIKARRSGVVPGKVIEVFLNQLFLAVLKDQVRVANRMLGQTREPNGR